MRGLEQQVPGLSAVPRATGPRVRPGVRESAQVQPRDQVNAHEHPRATTCQKFRDWQIATKITGDNIVQNLGTAMEHLHQTVKDSTRRTNQTDALAELQKLHDGAVSLFKSMESKVATSAEAT